MIVIDFAHLVLSAYESAYERKYFILAAKDIYIYIFVLKIPNNQSVISVLSPPPARPPARKQTLFLSEKTRFSIEI